MGRLREIQIGLESLVSRLNCLLREAVDSADYEEATELASLAARLQSIVVGGRESTRALNAVSRTRPIDVAVAPRPSVDGEHSAASISPPSAVPAQNSECYPRYELHAGDLVKIGWSLKNQSEYEHTVPRFVIPFFVEVLLDISKKKRLFSMDDIGRRTQELASSKKAASLPSYQLYAVIGWMKEVGFVVYHGRRGYALANNGTLREDIKSALEMLPDRVLE